MPESAETRLKAAMHHEAEQLWRELRLLRWENTAELQRVEKSVAEALPLLQGVEELIAALHPEESAANCSPTEACDFGRHLFREQIGGLRQGTCNGQ